MYDEASWDDNKSAFSSRSWGCAFGLDPELFVMDRNARTVAKSVHISGINFAALNRNNGPNRTNGNWNMVAKPDGWAFECNTQNGSSCRDSTIPYMATAFKKFYVEYPALKLSAIPVMKLNAASLLNAPEDVMGYGCVPDRNAYELTEKSPPKSGYRDAFRYAGGHLHISGIAHGYDANMACALYALLGDIFVGLPMVAIIGETNDYGESRRREYYGEAGSYRVQNYSNHSYSARTGAGFEYRVLSSAIMLSPILLSYAIGSLRSMLHNLKEEWQRAVKSEEALVAYVHRLDQEFDFGVVRSIIDNHDVEAARDFVAKKLKTYDWWYMRPFYDLMIKADKAKVGFMTDFYKSWDLDRTVLHHKYIGVESATAKKAWSTGAFFPQEEFAPGAAWTYKATKSF